MSADQFAETERDLRRLHAAGRLLPSELSHRKLLKWPGEAAIMIARPRAYSRRASRVATTPV
jgi:hypothetical protein